jgi:hypothetical protein
MRATRDRLRRRNHLMHQRAELYAHSPHTASPYHLRDPLGRLATPQNRRGLIDRFGHGCVQQNVAVDLALVDGDGPRLAAWERSSEPTAHGHEPVLTKLASRPGKGEALSILAHTRGRAVYCMLQPQVACAQTTFLATEGGRERTSLASHRSHRGTRHHDLRIAPSAQARGP